MNAILTIARLTFQEAVRRRIALAALVLGILFLIIYGIGVDAILTEIKREGDGLSAEVFVVNLVFTMGMYVVNFLMIMMTVLTSVDTLSGEILSGTVHTIAAKPLRRFEIVLGKWLGFVAMFALYFLLMAGGVILIVRVIGDYSPANILSGAALIGLNVLVLLSLSLLGGTRLSTLANGTMLFGLYGVAFVGSWIEQIGSMVGNSVAMNVGIVSSLILPSEALWRSAADKMSSPLAAITGVTPFSLGGAIPSPYFIGYAIFYAVFMLFLAIRLFSQRDL